MALHTTLKNILDKLQVIWHPIPSQQWDLLWDLLYWLSKLVVLWYFQSMSCEVSIWCAHSYLKSQTKTNCSLHAGGNILYLNTTASNKAVMRPCFVFVLAPCFVTVDSSGSDMQLWFYTDLLHLFFLHGHFLNAVSQRWQGDVRRNLFCSWPNGQQHAHAYIQMLLCVFLTAALTSLMWPWAAGHTWKGECVTNRADI